MKKLPSNLNKAKIVFKEYDDWEEIIIDREIIYAEHRLSPSDWIDFIERAFGVVIEYEYVESDENDE